ncbi:MAG: hypothetical protein IKH43_06235 [Bacteroidaceae bacterium]|nr:hypothetical protein [Bacteroidaceae bacterium]
MKRIVLVIMLLLPAILGYGQEGTGDTVYVVISSQNVPTPPKSVLPEVNIAERMKEAEEFGKRLRQEFDSIHLAFNK